MPTSLTSVTRLRCAPASVSGSSRPEPPMPHCDTPVEISTYRSHVVMYLSVVSVGFVAALFGIAAALWFTVVWLRRNRSWRRVAVVGAVVVTLAGIADTVNWHFEYWPHLGDVL